MCYIGCKIKIETFTYMHDALTEVAFHRKPFSQLIFQPINEATYLQVLHQVNIHVNTKQAVYTDKNDHSTYSKITPSFPVYCAQNETGYLKERRQWKKSFIRVKVKFFFDMFICL